MDPSQRIVTSTPLVELWNDEGPVNARRLGDVGEAEIVQLLRDGSIFVVAEVGQPLRWILQSDRFGFWKAEAKGHLVAPDADGFHLDDYPGHYCYVATLWECAPATTVIILEKHH